MKYLLDTHAWVWWHSAPQLLSARARMLIAKVGLQDSLLLASISLWEFAKLLEKKRIIIACEPDAWFREALDMPRLQVVSLSARIALSSVRLPGAFHDDPADQIIVATAREEGATIITKDQRILEYKHVKSAW